MAFWQYTWEGLCSTHLKDKGFAQVVTTAREAKQKLAQNETKQTPENLADQVFVGIELEKSFIVASEKDMRSQVKDLHRVPRMALKGLSSLRVPAEANGGEEEVVYLFRDPNETQRKAKLKPLVSMTLKELIC
eukprot:6491928-Amphidinium_carterae.2